ncbi:MAG: hypothetical protein RL410_976 [Actinomycetota bacterium]|jgi:N-acetylglucosamine-6-phosphate deacetylase
MRYITADIVVTPDREIAHGYVAIDNGVIVEVSSEGPADSEKFSGALIPGFVDIHCHGGGGFSFGVLDEIRGAANFHLQHGTTTILASQVSRPITEAIEILESARGLVAEGVIAGIHLEGPFLSHARCGAQNPAALIDPSADLVSAVIKAGQGVLKHITIAPELPGAIDAIRALTAAGITVAVGHSEATAEQGVAAFDAGAKVVTHFFNGMRPYDHPDTSFGMAALEDERISTEIIADGVHVGLDKVRMVHDKKGRRFISVTDAIVAAGMPDGDWNLGGLAVTTQDGVAHLSGTKTLAGSTLTMERAFSFLVSKANLSLVEAVQATSTEPARAMGFAHVGSIEVGKEANFVVWNDGVQHVIRHGNNISL